MRKHQRLRRQSHSPKTQLSQWLSDTDAKRSPTCGLILIFLKCSYETFFLMQGDAVLMISMHKL